MEQLQEDFDYMTAHLMELVPTVDLYVDKQNLESSWQALRASINKPMTDLDFFPILAAAVSAVEEGHVYLSGWNDESSHVYQRLLRDKAGILPIQSRVIDGELYMWQNRSELELAPKRGERIVRINGESSTELVKKLSQLIPVDANIENARYHELDRLFRVWYFLLHKQPEYFVVEAEDANGNVQEYEFQPLSIDKQHEIRVERYGEPEARPPLDATNFYHTEVWRETNTLYLNVFSYHESLLRKHEVSPAEFWQTIFNQLDQKGLENLVIDLRENRGGRNEFVWALLPHINKNQLTGTFSRARAYDGKSHGTKLQFDIPAYQPDKVFSGNLYALINGNTFSNGSMTAMALKEFANATLIGSETASRYQGYAASSWRQLTLPNTQIPIRIPYFVTQFPVADSQTGTNQGVAPDIEIRTTIDDLIQEHDPVLEKVKMLVDSAQNREH